jgi:hypothetical protein
MFSVEHCIERSFDLEAAAAQMTDSKIRDSYLELARGFRAMANAGSIADSITAEQAVKLAERMVGRGFHAH